MDSDHPETRGRKPRYDYDANPKGAVEPKKGTLRYQALELLTDGASIEELEEFMEDYRDRKGAEWKMTPRYRALEILKLLSKENGYGFERDADDGKIWALEVEQ